MTLFVLMLTSGLCAAHASERQTVLDLEWTRQSPIMLATLLPGSDADMRSRIARSLGRLRTAHALVVLQGLRDDEDEGVRAEVAAALGHTPGSEDTIRAWLAETSAPEGLIARRRAQTGVRAQLAQALGRQGSSRDIAQLVSMLEEPWPTGAAAASGLARMARRKVTGLEIAIPGLVRALERTDARYVQQAAAALFRIGMAEASQEDLKRVLRRATTANRASTRAWLVRASWSHLEEQERGDLFVAAATDRSRLVRVAAFEAIDRQDLPMEIVEPFTQDQDAWVRIAAIGALGRMSDAGEEALGRYVPHSPWDGAFAIQARGTPDVDSAANHDLPEQIRAAWVANLQDHELLVGYALNDESAVVRTGAASALLKDESAGLQLGLRLLPASDAIIRHVGVELVGREKKARAAVDVLLPHLGAEHDLEVLWATLNIIGGHAEKNRRVIPAGDEFLKPAIARAVQSGEPRLLKTANHLTTQLGADDQSTPSEGPKRELVVGEDKRVFLPSSNDANAVLTAEVHTSRGRFTIEMDPDVAPMAVANFAFLAEAGFYDGIAFHRVVPGFVAQSGCPRGDGWGGPGWSIPDEVSQLDYSDGSVGMARSEVDTGGSQWFITTSDQPHLVGEYTRFGEVVQGLYVVHHLELGDLIERIDVHRVRSELAEM